MKTALIVVASVIAGGSLTYFGLWLWALREFMR
jgi:hypothetical protein